MKTIARTINSADFAEDFATGFAFSLLMSLLIAVSARFSFLTPMSPVPVSLQVGAVILAGLCLGPKWGTWSIV